MDISGQFKRSAHPDRFVKENHSQVLNLYFPECKYVGCRHPAVDSGPDSADRIRDIHDIPQTVFQPVPRCIVAGYQQTERISEVDHVATGRAVQPGLYYRYLHVEIKFDLGAAWRRLKPLRVIDSQTRSVVVNQDRKAR